MTTPTTAASTPVAATPAATTPAAATPAPPPPSAPAPRPPASVRVSWAGERRFDAGRPDAPTARFDGAGKTGPTPVEALVGALAACSMVDVVEILAKRRTPVDQLTVDALADRASATPARVTRVALVFTLDGSTVDRAQAERAIDLALTKYCSVRDSLNPAIVIVPSLTLNGEPGQRIELGGAAGAARPGAV